MQKKVNDWLQTVLERKILLLRHLVSYEGKEKQNPMSGSEKQTNPI